MTIDASRREFLRTASRLSVAGAATPWAINLAAIGAASAQTAPTDYKALVCVFMYGGNDHSNMVVPYDNAGYQLYAQSRTNLTLPQTALLPLTTPTNPSMTGRQVSLRSELQPIKTIYDAGKAAVLANVGTLVVPTTMAQYRARSVPLPPSLFSHNDQQSVWQTYNGRREGARVGWGGKMGDLFASANQYQNFTCISASGTAVFLSGQSSVQMQIGNNGGLAIGSLAGNALFGSSAGPATARRLMTEDRSNLLEKDYNAIVKRSTEAAQTLNTALAGFPTTAAPFSTFPNTGLGNQLRNVARLIAARQALGAQRQVFHVSIGGFDQHSGLITGHGGRMTELANAMAAFYNATVSLGISDSVTAFTASDFGRTLDSNGEGSDHGWGAHHFVVGGSVKGGDLYGTWPDTVLRGPNDVGRGNLLPTTSVNQYASTLATWFGITAAQLGDVLPNAANFPQPNLGFMA
ncbi:MAG TPA: DUF1501 domain-containing protein [Burkholderiaceae bacterium]|nr:DUF1501 domain-containing protein [Burkholderiaceae bacterium]HQR70299.1 DUF1501 domain-containing protein [Burkholderiaceae bacterium]